MTILAENYGPLQYVVSSATAVAGATVAIWAIWRPRGTWEPDTDELPQAPERVALVIATAMIALLWNSTRDGNHHGTAVTALVASVGACVLAFVVYFLLITLLTLNREVVVNGDVVTRKMIGGFWMTDHARRQLREKAISRQDLLAGMAYDAQQVWSPLSLALAKTSLIVAYLLFLPAGTVAIATAGMVVADV